MRKKKRKERVLNSEVEVFRRSKLLRKYTAKILFGQNNRKFKNKYLKKLEKSQVRQKGKEEQVFPEVEL